VSGQGVIGGGLVELHQHVSYSKGRRRGGRLMRGKRRGGDGALTRCAGGEGETVYSGGGYQEGRWRCYAGGRRRGYWTGNGSKSLVGQDCMTGRFL
jgi:hypothetical protein